MSTAEAFETERDDQTSGEALSVAPDVVEIRRNAGVSGVVAVAASGVAIAYLSRAAQTGAALDWALVAVMGVLAAVWLRAFTDARTPLVVADSQGVRLRLGRTWRGLPWGALADVEHQPRRGLLRDGRVVFTPRNPERVLAELDAGGRRQAAWAARLHGSEFAVPLGLTTRVVGGDGDLTAALRELAHGAVTVHEPAPQVVEPREETVEAPIEETIEVDDELEVEASRARRLPDPRPALAHGIGSVADLFARRQRDEDLIGDTAEDAIETDLVDDRQFADVDDTAEVEVAPEIVASETPAPLREPRSARRTEATARLVRDADRVDTEQIDVDQIDTGEFDAVESGGRELRRPGRVSLVEDLVGWGSRVRPISTPGEPVAPLVIEDVDVEPALDPVIGPELAAARTRLGLDVDQLAERTRIRPHVIESIEVDDFVPCGGDFYARGHLRTLARVLGVEASELLAVYDERYADAPISPRRVFEAELATGPQGTLRSTRGGPNWSLLVGAVMVLVLAWSIARLVMDEPQPLAQPAIALNGSESAAKAPAVLPETATLRLAASASTTIVVRDASGEIVWSGPLEAGDSQRLTDLEFPVRVRADDLGALRARVDGERRGILGDPGQSGRMRLEFSSR